MINSVLKLVIAGTVFSSFFSPAYAVNADLLIEAASTAEKLKTIEPIGFDLLGGKYWQCLKEFRSSIAKDNASHVTLAGANAILSSEDAFSSLEAMASVAAFAMRDKYAQLTERPSKEAASLICTLATECKMWNIDQSTLCSSTN